MRKSQNPCTKTESISFLIGEQDHSLMGKKSPRLENPGEGELNPLYY